jgi:hypothetical protein
MRPTSVRCGFWCDFGRLAAVSGAGALAAIALTLALSVPARASVLTPITIKLTTAQFCAGHSRPATLVRRLCRGNEVVHGRRGRSLPGSARARAAIVGGNQIAITEAPWQVDVEAFTTVHIGAEIVPIELLCGGSILNTDEVLTAAHCVYNPETRARIPAEQILVLAGASDFLIKEAEDQERVVSQVRVHPYFVYDPEAFSPPPDDVSVLKLKEALSSRSTAMAIPLVGAGSQPADGATVDLTGYGEQSFHPEEQNGRLYALSTNLVFSRECGEENDAVFLCASTPSGSLCLGDSGSGLTIPGLSATLAGVADTVQVIAHEPCRHGALNGFANLAAPEIQEFVKGSESPPRAPRGGGVTMRGVPMVGRSFTCEPGLWSGSPSFTYEFIDAASGQILLQGAASSYVLSAGDVGRTIFCRVEATNAGGTGLGQTTASPPIQAAPGSSQGPGAPPPGVQAAPERVAAERVGVASEHESKPPSQPRRCVVPDLKGDSLERARHALRRAHCALGKVSKGKHHGRLVVHSQSIPAGRREPHGTRVDVTLGPTPKSAHHV